MKTTKKKYEYNTKKKWKQHVETSQKIMNNILEEIKEYRKKTKKYISYGEYIVLKESKGDANDNL